MMALANYERDCLPMLKRIRDSHPNDLDRYDFVLKTAIDATTDGIESASADMDERAKDVQHKADVDRKAIEQMETPADRDAKKKQEKRGRRPATAVAAQASDAVETRRKTGADWRDGVYWPRSG